MNGNENKGTVKDDGARRYSYSEVRYREERIKERSKENTEEKQEYTREKKAQQLESSLQFELGLIVDLDGVHTKQG
jgi:hypothetical protein